VRQRQFVCRPQTGHGREPGDARHQSSQPADRGAGVRVFVPVRVRVFVRVFERRGAVVLPTGAAHHESHPLVLRLAGLRRAGVRRLKTGSVQYPMIVLPGGRKAERHQCTTGGTLVALRGEDQASAVVRRPNGRRVPLPAACAG